MDDIVKALMSPEAHEEDVSNIRMMQTAISYVFLTGKHVYKVKKPINLGFLDFTTLEKRKHFCEEELRLNRRLCEDMYLGVVPINKSDGKIKIGGKGKTVEYAVKMKEIGQKYIMTELLKKGQVDKGLIDRIAKILVDFHSKAKTDKEISKYGSLQVIRGNWDENFKQTVDFIGKTIPKYQFKEIKGKINGFIEENNTLFKRRIENGRVRECHGDVHSGNIFVPGNKIYIFDAIEFNKRFRNSDVAAEVAFLGMDLDFHERKDLSDHFIGKYVEYSSDKELLKLLDFYKCYRSYVRGKINSFQFGDPRMDEKGKNRSQKLAKRYFKLSQRYVKRI